VRHRFVKAVQCFSIRALHTHSSSQRQSHTLPPDACRSSFLIMPLTVGVKCPSGQHGLSAVLRCTCTSAVTYHWEEKTLFNSKRYRGSEAAAFLLGSFHSRRRPLIFYFNAQLSFSWFKLCLRFRNLVIEYREDEPGLQHVIVLLRRGGLVLFE
jgi:hypothetical protein